MTVAESGISTKPAHVASAQQPERMVEIHSGLPGIMSIQPAFGEPKEGSERLSSVDLSFEIDVPAKFLPDDQIYHRPPYSRNRGIRDIWTCGGDHLILQGRNNYENQRVSEMIVTTEPAYDPSKPALKLDRRRPEEERPKVYIFVSGIPVELTLGGHKITTDWFEFSETAKGEINVAYNHYINGWYSSWLVLQGHEKPDMTDPENPFFEGLYRANQLAEVGKYRGGVGEIRFDGLPITVDLHGPTEIHSQRDYDPYHGYPNPYLYPEPYLPMNENVWAATQQLEAAKLGANVISGAVDLLKQ